MSHTVLCVVDFDNYPETVLNRAARIAKLHDCKLQVLVSDPQPSFFGESFVFPLEAQMIADDLQAMRDGVLKMLQKSAADAGVEFTLDISRERDVAGIIRHTAADIDPRFVVKGTHLHTPSERASFADTDWELIRQLRYPLWIVKPQPWNDAPLIIAAVDPTHKDDKAATLDRMIVKTGQVIAEKFGGKLQLLHIYQRLEEVGSRVAWSFKPDKLPVEELDAKIRAAHHEALMALAKVSDVPEKDVFQLPGRTHELLPAVVREHGANLVVMGALARSALKQRLVGSTAARVLDHLTCDVLVVHTG
jgi:universal stress protein E